MKTFKKTLAKLLAILMLLTVVHSGMTNKISANATDGSERPVYVEDTSDNQTGGVLI